MIKLFQVHMPPEVDGPLLETLHSGQIAQGQKVEEFEAKLSEFLGTNKVVTLNSGTSSLVLALRLAGVGPGDEVISTAMTCTATNLAVLQAGGTLVFADIHTSTGNITPYSIEKLITTRTKAILFVDWGGMPAELDEIMSIARAHNLKVIEDAAHAFGAKYKGKRVGQISDFTCFSLQAIKHITTGDGGILTCLDQQDYERAKILRWFGINREGSGLESRINQQILEWGYKFHMNDLAATIGIVQLDHIEKILTAQRVNAQYYNHHLSHYYQRSEDEESDIESANWLYTLQLPNYTEKLAFIEHMKEKGIEASVVHKRNDEYYVFKDVPIKYSFGLNSFSDRMVCIPVHWGLSIGDLNYIIDQANYFSTLWRNK